MTAQIRRYAVVALAVMTVYYHLHLIFMLVRHLPCYRRFPSYYRERCQGTSLGANLLSPLLFGQIVPETPVTKGLIGASEVALMKQGAFLINNARGSVTERSTVLVGTSRIQTDVDPQVWADEVGGEAPIQLGMAGTPSLTAR